MRITDRSVHSGLGVLTRDFAIFDADTGHPAVILFSYDTEGCLLGYEATEDRKIAARCWQQYLLALRWSVSLSEFTAVSQAR